MMLHNDINGEGFARSRILKGLIASEQISLGGNSKLKIYGMLNCSSGRRMKIANRIFFKDEQEALVAGYRPCGHCMRKEYQKWKLLNSRQKNQSKNKNN